MTDRERWVVYPLLFLALGVSLRDKLGGQLTSKIISCQKLVIEDEPVGSREPRPLAVLGRVQPNPNRPAIAALEFDGEFLVNGNFNVNGIVNVSKHFAINGLPLGVIQFVPPATSPVRPAPQTAPLPQSKSPGNKTSPPTDDSTKSSPPADKSATEPEPKN